MVRIDVDGWANEGLHLGSNDFGNVRLCNMWLRGAREFGQISAELSAEESVDHLHATANSEGRHLVFLRVGQKNGFSMIPLGKEIVECIDFSRQGLKVVSAGKKKTVNAGCPNELHWVLQAIGYDHRSDSQFAKKD